MAYFECVYGAAIGLNIPLVVTCAASFAGLTITCTDGITTLTAPCPSSSPYEVTFMLPNTGTWTVSGTISGQTFSESVLVEEFDVVLVDKENITVDVFSAVNDTISYTGIDGQIHTIVTDSNGYANETITVYSSRTTTLVFTSSVAKDVENDDLSTAYSKSINLTTSSTEIKIMPDNAYTWYGNQCTWNSGGWQCAKFNDSGSTASMTIEDYALKPRSSNYDWNALSMKTARNFTTNTQMKLVYKGSSMAYVLTNVAPSTGRNWDANYVRMLNNHYPNKTSLGLFSETITSSMTGSNVYYQIKNQNSLFLQALLITN